jgi:hypothetical protein
MLMTILATKFLNSVTINENKRQVAVPTPKTPTTQQVDIRRMVV